MTPSNELPGYNFFIPADELFHTQSSTVGGRQIFKVKTELLPDNCDLVIPETIAGEPVTEIANKAFEGGSIKSIIIPKTVTSIHPYSFFACSASIVVDPVNENFCSAEGVLFDKNKTRLLRFPPNQCATEYNVPDTVDEIYYGAFAGCDSLKTIAIPNSVTKLYIKSFDGYPGTSCGALLIVDPDNKYFSSQDGILFDKQRETLLRYPAILPVGIYEIPNFIKRIAQGAFSHCSHLNTVVIPESVTHIDEHAFVLCVGKINVDSNNSKYSSVSGVLFDKNKTTLLRFPPTSSIKSYKVPSSVKTIADGAFSCCFTLEKLTLPESVGKIGSFFRCTSLKSINIPSNLTEIEDTTFCGCSSLTNITLPDGISFIGKLAFDGCSSLKSIVIPNSVKSIGDNIFSECISLENVTLSESIEEIPWGAFYKCSSLKTINLPYGIDTIKSHAFYNTGLTSIVLPDSLIKIEFSAFDDCKSLTTVVIPESVTKIDSWGFSNCPAKFYVYKGSYAKEWAIKNKLNYEVIKSLPTKEGIYGIREVPNGISIRLLKDSTLPQDYDLIIPSTICERKVVKIDESAFENLSNIRRVVLPYTIERISERGFYNCSSLESIELPPRLKIIDDLTFYNCSSLTSLNIPDSVQLIGDGAFAHCSSLTAISIPDTVQIIGGAFWDCTSLKSIVLPEQIKEIPEGMFANCSSLTHIIIPPSVQKVGISAFEGCSSLKSIIIPHGVTQIPYQTFLGCSSLTNVVIPNTVETIVKCAFYGCSSLTELYIPPSVKQIGSDFGSTKIMVKRGSFAEDWARNENVAYEVIE